jgi:hypothetical protein
MSEITWIWYVILGIIYLAILYALVKPGSPVAAGVTGISAALSALITTAVGGTPNTSSNAVPAGGIQS